MQCRSTNTARGFWLTEWPVHCVQQTKRFDSAIVEVIAVALKRHDATNIDIPQIHRWTAINNPVGKHLACTTRRLNTDRVETCCNKQTWNFWLLAEQVTIVWCERFRTVEEQTDSGLCEQRHTVSRVLDERRNVFEVFWQ